MLDNHLMPGARVAEIWRYPVKSMQGERLAEGRFTELGLDGDRRWAVRDVATGTLVTGKQDTNILNASARSVGESVEISLPDGQILDVSGPGTNAALSAWLERDVVLEAAGPDSSGTYALYLDPADETSEVMEFLTPDGTFLDAGAVHLLTTASLRAVAEAAPGSAWDARRFRPTLLVEADGAEGYVEDAWVGTSLRIGSTAMTVLMPTLRCGIPGRAQPGLDADIDVIRSLKRERRALLGVYAAVETEGVVAEGDAITQD